MEQDSEIAKPSSGPLFLSYLTFSSLSNVLCAHISLAFILLTFGLWLSSISLFLSVFHLLFGNVWAFVFETLLSLKLHSIHSLQMHTRTYIVNIHRRGMSPELVTPEKILCNLPSFWFGCSGELCTYHTLWKPFRMSLLMKKVITAKGFTNQNRNNQCMRY